MRRAPFLILLLFPAVAFADVVKLKDGSSIEGTVSERDGKIVVTIRPGMEVVVDRDQVVSIEKGTGAREELERRRRELVPGDPEPRFELALWCKKMRFETERRELLEEVLKLAPDHARARAELGYVKDGDKWILESELRRKLGFEKVGGRWIPAEEAKRLKRQEELKKLVLSTTFKLKKPDQAAAARAQLEALKDPPEVLAPLFVERLDEHDPDVRRTFAELLEKVAHPSAAQALLKLTFMDEVEAVRVAAARSLWATNESAARTALVQSLFANGPARRERAADALGVVKDADTVPYLIEALVVAVEKKTTEIDEEASVVREAPGGPVGLQGQFGGYNAPRTGFSWARGHDGTTIAYVRQRWVLLALQKITGKDFDYSQVDWWKWWNDEGRAKLGAKPAPPGGK